MLIAIIRYLQGYLRIRIIGYSPERFLNLCSHKQIYLWGLTPVGNSYEMFIRVRDFRKLKPILKKTRTKVTVAERIGFPFFLHKYRKRKVFFGGALCCLLLIYVMSLFIWNIHIEGNFSRTDETILQFLQTKQVYHGMRKRNVDCERIVKDIRKEFDDIVWVSAYVNGTRLMIKVKENTDTFPIKSESDMEIEQTPSDIVADKDGIITSMVTRTGVPLVRVGEQVKTGDTLVSGQVEVKNDAGEVVHYQYQNADADIQAETTIPYEAEHSLSYSEKKYLEKRYFKKFYKKHFPKEKLEKKHVCYIKMGDYSCFFGNWNWNRKKYEKKYKKTAEWFSTEKQVQIGEHFLLPICYGRIEIRPYQCKEKVYTKEEMQILLSKEFQTFCQKLEEQEMQVLEHNVKIYLKPDTAKAKGTIRIVQKIGEYRKTEKIDL